MLSFEQLHVPHIYSISAQEEALGIALSLSQTCLLNFNYSSSLKLHRIRSLRDVNNHSLQHLCMFRQNADQVYFLIRILQVLSFQYTLHSNDDCLNSLRWCTKHGMPDVSVSKYSISSGFLSFSIQVIMIQQNNQVKYKSKLIVLITK